MIASILISSALAATDCIMEMPLKGKATCVPLLPPCTEVKNPKPYPAKKANCLPVAKVKRVRK